jgi:hypothetical protein
MKREIKFRGKRIDNGEWAYGYYLKDAKGRHCIKDTPYHNNDRYFDLLPEYVIPETVGQLTGVKDANGKDIYEGDIVKAQIERGNFTTEVKWGARSHGWSLKCDRTAERWGTIKYYAIPAPHEVAVVGNIHDNPDMLKMEKLTTK